MRDMRTKLRLAIKNKDSGYNKAKRESEQNYKKLGDTRGPLNLRIFMTSKKQNLTRTDIQSHKIQLKYSVRNA